MRSTKSSGATRLIWRMTAENQLGELLELPEDSRSAANRASKRSRRARSEQVTSPARPGDSTGSAFGNMGDPRGPVPAAASSANVCSWRASSYDLLQGLSVRDVSERIPQRAFEALFSADPASAGKQ